MTITDRYPWMTRKRALVALGAATLGFTVALYLLDPQAQGYGGASISDFEFAGSSSRAAQIMAAVAGFAIRDTARDRGWRRMARAGIVVPYFALAAACFDASENVALLLTLGGHGGSFAPPFATVCSGIKWMLIGIAILYVLCGLALLLRAWQSGSAAHPADRPARDPRPTGKAS
jgi:hypothetical protein